MTILFVARDSLACSLVESFLTHRFRGRPGCRNIQPGGESAKKGEGPFSLIVSWVSCDFDHDSFIEQQYS